MDVTTMLPLLKVAAVFGMVILMLRLSVPVGFALSIGGLMLGLFFSMKPLAIVQTFGSALVEDKAITLAVIITLILLLSNSMEHLGLMEELLERFRRVLRRSRIGLVIFPSLIGLLPMPGGAVFSAPMLDGFARETAMTPEQKSFLNYWFRHIWEYWWPLYPGVLLTCSIADLKIWQYVSLALPLTVIAVAVGVPRLIRTPRLEGDLQNERKSAGQSKTWRSICPIGLAILPGLVLSLLRMVPGGFTVSHEMGLIAGLVAAVACSWFTSDVGLEDLQKIVFDPRLVRMWVTVAGVFVFKGIIEQSGAAGDLGQVLLRFKVPLAWVVVLLPMAVGGITGLTIAFVGATFPILISLIQTLASPDLVAPFAVLAMASGLIGILMSPVHLCLILSNEHFGASWSGVYRHLSLPSLGLFVGSVGYFWFLRGVLL
jgi:hypothetical protein